MRKHVVIPAIAAMIFFAACRKTIDSFINQVQPPAQPATTSVGTPVGDAVSKTIGSAGGNISSPDGKLELIIPAGAVLSDTVFSIQPISNYCPGGLNGYRLLPDGTTFSTPVTLRFKYTNDDVNGSLAAFFTIAYQDKDNVWYSIPSVKVDSVNKTISVQTKHFTDWSDVQLLKVKSITVDDGVQLTIEGVPMQVADRASDKTALGEVQSLPAKWFVNGIQNGNDTLGKIVTASGGGGDVQYSMPDVQSAVSDISIWAQLTDLSEEWPVKNIILSEQLPPIKMSFSVHLESTTDEACAAPGSFEFDEADMVVDVYGNEVTVSNITNQAPSIINPSVQYFNCTITASPGPTGSINITSASGFAYKSSQMNVRSVSLALVNSNTSTQACDQQCAYTSSSSPAIVDTSSITSYFSFDIVDSVQSFGKKGQNASWVITPLH
ncbi:MAG: hypothetical protein QM764_06860 [Chitinophagaceae bacterium]